VRPFSPTPKRLVDLAEHFRLALHSDAPDVVLTGITMNSKDVEPGDLYLGLPGARFHGAAFAKDAVARGAVAVVTDASGAVEATAAGVPVLLTPTSPRSIAGQLAAWIYGTATDGPLTLGVTGTNGKTSTVHFLDAILTQLGKKTGLSSTAQRRIGDEVVVSSLTTPEAPELHGLLARMHEVGVDAAILEVSAHALTRHRVDGVVFDVAAFTNLSHDHLDDYADMDEYFEAKLALFTPEHSRKAVISLDTAAGYDVVERASIDLVTISSTPDVASDWVVTITREDADFTAFTLTSPSHGSVSTRVPVIGRHMAANGGLAIAMLVEAGIGLDDIRTVLDRDGAITATLPGRAVRVPVTDGPNVYVDAGHSPDAFAKTLESVRSLTRGRVIMVAGANGDRDAIKRPEMGREAALGSDVLIITDHQPRSEDPALIRKAVLAGARHAKPDGDIREIAAPELAIRAAVAEATATDTILWAGLAEKEYREVAGVKIPFSVLAETRAALAEAGWV
jgi:UDP-N-acetylmuramoyl-L-alanyl-D-glutamate--2,6-diaminopimelate ligase